VLQGTDGKDIAARYQGQIASHVWPDLIAASRVAYLFHRMPRWWHHLLSRMPGSLSAMVGVLAGEQTYTGLLRQILQRVEARADRWVRCRLGVRQDGPPKPGRA
jgi:hypothetical protein